ETDQRRHEGGVERVGTPPIRFKPSADLLEELRRSGDVAQGPQHCRASQLRLVPLRCASRPAEISDKALEAIGDEFSKPRTIRLQNQAVIGRLQISCQGLDDDAGIMSTEQ